MALKFICNTCGEEYDAQLSGKNIIYIDDNKRRQLDDENQDCNSCEREMEISIKEAKEKAREALRAKKQNGQQG